MSHIDVADLAAALAQAAHPHTPETDAVNILDGLSIHEVRHALLLYANYISTLIEGVAPDNLDAHMEEVEILFQSNLQSLMRGEHLD